ncbi:MAG TPA: diacylglycerol kinase family lipid kinase [Anaerolineae bacterium]|nr:diacylglycerol kinase family lipid kinase [Anaerolineae bacterium]
MSRYKIVVNPVSGRGAGESAIPHLDHQLREYGLDFDLVATERPWHAVELAQKAVADGYNVVVAVGGDGTANEVLNGLMLAKKAGVGEAVLGLVGVGRGNDLAFGMGVPSGLDIGHQILYQDNRRTVDVGLVKGGMFPEGRYFGNGVGIGFDAVVGFEALKMKRIHGFLNYFLAALKTIFLYYQAPLVRIEYNDKIIDQLSLLVSIMNGRRMGGGFWMAPEAEIDDGLFDLCIGGQLSKLGILALIPRFMQGTQASHPAVQTGRTNKIEVTAQEGILPAHADGETICTEGKQLIVELLAGEIEVICQSQDGV